MCLNLMDNCTKCRRWYRNLPGMIRFVLFAGEGVSKIYFWNFNFKFEFPFPWEGEVGGGGKKILLCSFSSPRRLSQYSHKARQLCLSWIQLIDSWRWITGIGNISPQYTHKRISLTHVACRNAQDKWKKIWRSFFRNK